MRTPRPSNGLPRLRLEVLEGREVPALVIQWDYSLDLRANGGSGYFESHPAAKDVLARVAADVAAQFGGSLAPITPAGANTWTATFFNPETGLQTSVVNPSIPADTVRVYVGGRNIPGSEGADGGGGGYSASGTLGWFDALRGRGRAGYAPWGGSLTFDTGTDWYTGAALAGIGPTQVDLYSVATHEIGHLLGIGTAPQWFALVSNGAFTGARAEAAYGGPVPVGVGDANHWRDGLQSGGRAAVMDPNIRTGTRIAPYTALDLAAFADLGWPVVGITPGATASTAPAGAASTAATPPTAPAFTPVPLGAIAPHGSPVVLTGPDDGSAQVFTLGAGGQLAAAGAAFVPFPGAPGAPRAVVADFNGDGTPDYALGTGPGAAAAVRVYDGKTGADLAGPTAVLDGFTGGVFLAAGDIDRDGAAELVVSADAGGGTRINLFKAGGGKLTLTANFLALDDPDFRGGARVAVGDVNRDGYADLVVGAGAGGGPRVAVYDGKALAAGRRDHLIHDFFALDPGLRGGVFVAAADLDGDGYADLVYSAGTSGGPRVRVVSGQVLAAAPGVDAYALPALADAFVLDPADREGIRIAARDLDGNGTADLIVGSGSRAATRVRVLTLADLRGPLGGGGAVQDPFADPLGTDGVYPG